jgi:hypothetical protein
LGLDLLWLGFWADLIGKWDWFRDASLKKPIKAEQKHLHRGLGPYMSRLSGILSLKLACPGLCDKKRVSFAFLHAQPYAVAANNP